MMLIRITHPRGLYPFPLPLLPLDPLISSLRRDNSGEIRRQSDAHSFRPVARAVLARQGADVLPPQT